MLGLYLVEGAGLSTQAYRAIITNDLLELHMTDNITEITKVVLDKTIGPIMDLLTKIAAPAAEEIGLTLRDNIQYYREKRKYLLLEKTRRFLTEQGIEPQPVPLKVLLPALEYASVEDDDYLHTMWAALLTTAADPSADEVLPSFPDVLRQLSKQEALFLQGLYEISAEWQRVHDNERCTMNLDHLQKIYVERVESKRTDLVTFRLFYDDLLRLRLIAEMSTTFTPTNLMPNVLGTPRTQSIKGMYMTDYGMRFVGACHRSNRWNPELY